jgi:hypothetical protein
MRVFCSLQWLNTFRFSLLKQSASFEGVNCFLPAFCLLLMEPGYITGSDIVVGVLLSYSHCKL